MPSPIKYPSSPPPVRRIAKNWHERDEWSKKHGPHAAIYSQGDENYTGEWQNNLRHGRGTHVGKNHEFVYEGQWENDQRCGYGTLSVPLSKLSFPVTEGTSGSSTTHTNTKGKGIRKNSFTISTTVREAVLGVPTHTIPSKQGPIVLYKIYTGDWDKNVRNGVGTAYYGDGSRYEGHWSNNVRCGWGTMYYADQSRYDGEWYNDMRHGQGILLLANHDRYEGIFVNDKKEGPGKFYFKHRKQIYEGEWSDDMPKCGVIHDLETRAFHAAAGMVQACNSSHPRLPVLELSDPVGVLAKQRQEIQEKRMERFLGTQPTSHLSETTI